MKMKISFAVLSILTLGLAGCAGSSDEDVSISEIAAATVSGAVNSAPGGTLALGPKDQKTLLDTLKGLYPVATAYAGNNACPLPTTGVQGTDCSVDTTGKIMTLVYNSCDFGSRSAVWDGTEILTSSAAVSCGSNPSEEVGATLTRTFGDGTTRTIANSVHVSKIDTTAPSGYEKAVSGGTVTTYKTETSRTIEIRGVHVLSQKIYRGNGNEGRVQTEADHSVSTNVEAPIAVSVQDGKRVVNGTVIVQHNDQSYTGTSVFKDVTYAQNSNCCLPQSGSITTTLSGSKTGSETIEFTAAECGSGKIKIGDAEQKEVLLSRCF